MLFKPDGNSKCSINLFRRKFYTYGYRFHFIYMDAWQFDWGINNCFADINHHLYGYRNIIGLYRNGYCYRNREFLINYICHCFADFSMSGW